MRTSTGPTFPGGHWFNAGPPTPILATSFLLAGLGTVVLGPLLPSLLHEWQLTDQRGGLLLLAKFVGAFAGGATVPRRLRVGILAGHLLAALGFAAFALAHGLALALPALFVTGVGLGEMIASTNILAGRLFPSHTGAALALLNFFWSLGAVSTGLLAAALLPPLGWRNPLLALAALYALTGALTLISAPSSVIPAHTPPFSPVISTQAPSSFPVTSTEAPPSSPLISTEAPPSFPVTSTEAPSFSPVISTEAPSSLPVISTEAPPSSPVISTEAQRSGEIRSSSPTPQPTSQPQPTTQPQPSRTRVTATYGLLLFLYGGLETCLTAWLTTFSLRLAGGHLLGGQSGFVVLWAALTAGRVLASGLMRRFPERLIQRLSLVCCLLLVAALATAHSPRALSLTCILLGLALAPVFPSTFALLLVHHVQPRLAGTLLAVSGLGAALFPWLMGVVSTQTGSLRLAMAVPALLIPAMLLLTVLDFPKRESFPRIPAQKGESSVKPAL